MSRVLVYCENYMYGGVERFLTDLCAGLSRGGEVVLLHNDDAGFAARMAAALPGLRRVPVAVRSRPALLAAARARLPDLPARAAARAGAALLGGAFFASNVRAAEAALRGLGAPRPGDALHVVNGGYPGAESGAAVLEAAARVGLARAAYSVLSVHEPRFAPRVDPVCEEAVLRRASAVTANSEAGRAALCRLRGFPEGLVSVLPTGIAEPRPDPAAVARLRARWAPGGGPLIGAVGALYPLKGHRHLLDAAVPLLRAVPSARVVVVGDGECRGALEAQAAGLGIADSVVLAGYHPGDAAEAIAALDVLAHPSCQTEGIPYVVLEAMALGKPVVASAVGGVSEVARDGETGLLVPPADPAALAAALVRVLSEPVLAARLSAAARRLQAERHGLEAMLAGARALYGAPVPHEARRG